MPRTTTGRLETGAQLLDLRDAAMFAGLGVNTVRRYCKDGRFPKPVLVGTARRWRRKELEHWAAMLEAV